MTGIFDLLKVLRLHERYNLDTFDNPKVSWTNEIIVYKLFYYNLSEFYLNYLLRRNGAINNSSDLKPVLPSSKSGYSVQIECDNLHKLDFTDANINMQILDTLNINLFQEFDIDTQKILELKKNDKVQIMNRLVSNIDFSNINDNDIVHLPFVEACFVEGNILHVKYHTYCYTIGYSSYTLQDYIFTTTVYYNNFTEEAINSTLVNPYCYLTEDEYCNIRNARMKSAVGIRMTTNKPYRLRTIRSQNYDFFSFDFDSNLQNNTDLYFQQTMPRKVLLNTNSSVTDCDLFINNLPLLLSVNAKDFILLVASCSYHYTKGKNFDINYIKECASHELKNLLKDSNYIKQSNNWFIEVNKRIDIMNQELTTQETDYLISYLNDNTLFNYFLPLVQILLVRKILTYMSCINPNFNIRNLIHINNNYFKLEYSRIFIKNDNSVISLNSADSTIDFVFNAGKEAIKATDKTIRVTNKDLKVIGKSEHPVKFYNSNGSLFLSVHPNYIYPTAKRLQNNIAKMRNIFYSVYNINKYNIFWNYYYVNVIHNVSKRENLNDIACLMLATNAYDKKNISSVKSIIDTDNRIIKSLNVISLLDKFGESIGTKFSKSNTELIPRYPAHLNEVLSNLNNLVLKAIWAKTQCVITSNVSIYIDACQEIIDFIDDNKKEIDTVILLSHRSNISLMLSQCANLIKFYILLFQL